MEKEKYNIVLTSKNKDTVKCGAITLNFDGLNKFGLKDVTIEGMKKLQKVIEGKDIRFYYTDNFQGCFKTYTYSDGRKNFEKLKDVKSLKPKTQKPVVKEEPIEVVESITPVEEEITDGQFSESE